MHLHTRDCCQGRRHCNNTSFFGSITLVSIVHTNASGWCTFHTQCSFGPVTYHNLDGRTVRQALQQCVQYIYAAGHRRQLSMTTNICDSIWTQGVIQWHRCHGVGCTSSIHQQPTCKCSSQSDGSFVPIKRSWLYMWHKHEPLQGS